MVGPTITDAGKRISSHCQLKDSSMKHKIIVACPIFEEVLVRLREHFDVTDNQANEVWSKAEWTQKLSQHTAALTTSADPVDAEVLAACPQLKAVANMAVGYNNLDVPALTARGIQASNTPDVLTETTADFGFALLMATARRLTESEHFLRRGNGSNGTTTCLLALKYTAAPWVFWAWGVLVKALLSAVRMALA